MEYTVTWEIQIDADSPRKAAEEAREIQRDHGSEAVFFTVENMETSEKTDVDLLYDEDVDDVKEGG